jgi:hypothetical protein
MKMFTLLDTGGIPILGAYAPIKGEGGASIHNITQLIILIEPEGKRAKDILIGKGL